MADDSPLFAEAIVEVLNRDAELQVVGVASDGAEAVRLARRLSPDVVIMDVRMPVMDGLQAVQEIMRDCPVPILVMTSDPRGDSGELSFEALRRGALDLVIKPSSWPVSTSEQESIRQHIKLLSSVAVVQRTPRRREARAPLPPMAPPRSFAGPRRIIGIVASTGGPAALATLLGALPPDYPLPVLIVQHLAPGFAPRLAAWLDSVSSLTVRLAGADEVPVPGVALLAPDGAHLVVDRASGNVRLRRGDPVDGHLPSGTLLLRSVAEAYGGGAVGVVLTGMGSDGAVGLREVRRAGGLTFAQDEASSVVYGMPKAAQDIGDAERVLGLAEIAQELVRCGELREGV